MGADLLRLDAYRTLNLRAVAWCDVSRVRDLAVVHLRGGRRLQVDGEAVRRLRAWLDGACSESSGEDREVSDA